MKTKIFKTLAMLAAVSILVTGCDGLNNMVKRHSTDAEYVQTPNPMELHGDNVKINVAGSFKPNYFSRRAGVVFQPELQYDGKVLLLKPINLRGESATNLQGTTINRTSGGTFTYTDEIPYMPEYREARLIVNPMAYPAKRARGNTPASSEDASELRRARPLGEKLLAIGINTTPLLFDVHSAKPTLAADNYRKPDNIVKKSTLFFVVDMTNLNMRLAANQTEAAKQAFAEMEAALNSGMEIASIKVIA